jgi:hypothetical protein
VVDPRQLHPAALNSVDSNARYCLWLTHWSQQAGLTHKHVPLDTPHPLAAGKSCQRMMRSSWCKLSQAVAARRWQAAQGLHTDSVTAAPAGCLLLAAAQHWLAVQAAVQPHRQRLR